MGGTSVGPAFLQAGDAKTSAHHSHDQLAVLTVKEAIAAGAFRLNFQPTVSLDESNEQYFEVRCGLAYGSDSLPAGQLFDIADKLQLSGELDRWIVTRVFKLLGLYNQPNLNFSVWVSRESIQDPRFFSWIDSQLRDSAMTPGQVTFQISEQDARTEEDATKRFCLSLKDRGFSICLVEHVDELSSSVVSRELSQDLALSSPLICPLNLPLDYLRLAPEYIRNIQHESKRRLRLKKRVSALKRRGIRVIAAQLDDILLLPILWKARVDFAQGNCLRVPDQNIEVGIPHHQAISLH